MSEISSYQIEREKKNVKPETLFSKDVLFDTPKKLNRSEEKVSMDIIDEIEKGGVSVERLESLGLPVYKYKTQITIHGDFEGITKSRVGVGGYKNLLLNQNNSLGVKYNAIDANKKKIIADCLRLFRKYDNEAYRNRAFKVQFDSQGYAVVMDAISSNADEYKTKLHKVQGIYTQVPDIFIGTKDVWSYNLPFMGVKVIELYIKLNAIRQENLWEFIDVLTNGFISSEAIYDRYQEKEAEEHIVAEAQRKKEAETRKAEFDVKKEEFKKSISFPVMTEMPTTDTFAFGHVSVGADQNPEFKVYYVHKARMGKQLYYIQTYKALDNVVTTVDTIAYHPRREFKGLKESLFKKIDSGAYYLLNQAGNSKRPSPAIKKEVIEVKEINTPIVSSKPTYPSDTKVLESTDVYDFILTQHTKTGDDIYVIKLKQDVLNFAKLKDNFSLVRGYYSSFVKGFIVKSRLSKAEVDRLFEGVQTKPKGEGVDVQKEIQDIAEHSNVPVEEVQAEFDKGVKVESEHIDTVEKIMEGVVTKEEAIQSIVLDHLRETQKSATQYYDKLEEVEKELEAESKTDIVPEKVLTPPQQDELSILQDRVDALREMLLEEPNNEDLKDRIELLEEMIVEAKTKKMQDGGEIEEEGKNKNDENQMLEVRHFNEFHPLLSSSGMNYSEPLTSYKPESDTNIKQKKNVDQFLGIRSVYDRPTHLVSSGRGSFGKEDTFNPKPDVYNTNTNIQKNTKIKVLYLHGLDATPESDHVKILQSDFLEIISPVLDYNKPLFTQLEKIIQDENIKGVIGHSMGGYLAYYLSVKHHIDCLLYNPALELDSYNIQPIELFRPTNDNAVRMTVIGTDDEICALLYAKKALKRYGFKRFFEPIGHDIPDNIKIKYFEEFIFRIKKRNQEQSRFKINDSHDIEQESPLNNEQIEGFNLMAEGGKIGNMDIGSFLKLDDYSQRVIILKELRTTPIHIFLDKREAPLRKLADEIKEAIRKFSPIGINNAHPIIGEDYRAYFYPQKRLIKKIGLLRAMIIYFAHMASSSIEGTNKRYYSPERVRALHDFVQLFSDPDKKYLSYYERMKSVVFVKDMQEPKGIGYCILTMELVNEKLLRVHNIIASMTQSQIDRRVVKEINWNLIEIIDDEGNAKSVNQLLEIRSFQNLTAHIASSGGGDFKKEDAFAPENQTNIQQNTELPTKDEKKILNSRLIDVEPKILEILRKLKEHGSQALIVGGAVRDAIMHIEPKDIDIEVYNISYDELKEFLSPYGDVDLVGKAFGVIKFSPYRANMEYDFSVPRKENRMGVGHKGFEVSFDETMTIKEASMRRDFTFNALAYDPITNTTYDYFGGVRDIENKIIRHTSDKFGEDALRLLRAMQFQARFGFSIHPDTIIEMKNILKTDEFNLIPKERIFEEWMKWAEKGIHHDLLFKFLRDTTLIDYYPMLKRLKETPQDVIYHPEGDVEIHTTQCLRYMDKVIEREKIYGREKMTLVMSILLHDIGKPDTTEEKMKRGRITITSEGHEALGGKMAIEFLSSLGFHEELITPISNIVANHLAGVNISSITSPSGKLKAVKKLSRRLFPATISQLLLVMESDQNGRDNKSFEEPTGGRELAEIAKEINVSDKQYEYLLMGRHLIELGLKPSLKFGEILRKASEAQENGEFSDIVGAKKWLSENIDKLEDGGSVGKDKKAYLMTLEEYQKTVTPILVEYNKFIRKNEQYLVKSDYQGIYYYTFEEALADVESGVMVTRRGGRFSKNKFAGIQSSNEAVLSDWSYYKTGNFDIQIVPEPTPKGLLDKKNEFIQKLKKYFTDEELYNRVEKDETKSNKRGVRRAIENGTYKKILDDGEVKIEDIEKVASSVGVKLPKKLYDESVLIRQKVNQEISASIPYVNKAVMDRLISDIEESFKPLEKIVYDRETERYNVLIKNVLEQDEILSTSHFVSNIPIFLEIFNVENPIRRKGKGHDKWGREVEVSLLYLSQLSLKPNWKDVLHRYLIDYIEQLKWKMIGAILLNFSQINLPIKGFKQLELRVGAKGFEGEYKFEFENGSSFDFKTEAIGAGGYNIQVYHFRYLSNFNNARLSDGTKLSPVSYSDIINNFSDKKKLEEDTNPYTAVKKATELSEVATAIYKYLKSKPYNYNNVRVNDGKEEWSVTFKDTNLNRSRGLYLKKNIPIDDNKAKTYLMLESSGVTKPENFSA